MTILNKIEIKAVIAYITTMYQVNNDEDLLKFVINHGIVKDADEVLKEVITYKRIPDGIPYEWLNLQEILNDTPQYIFLINNKYFDIHKFNDLRKILLEEDIISPIKQKEEDSSFIEDEDLIDLLYEEVQDIKQRLSKLEKINKTNNKIRRKRTPLRPKLVRRW